MTGKLRVLFISSSGGHWTQLTRLSPAFEGWERCWACTNAGYRSTVPSGEHFFDLPEATRWNKLGLVHQAAVVFHVLLQSHPAVVVSTGASPGFFAMAIGRFMRKKTIWVDSIANVDQLSLSGRHAGRFADLWLTQWQHLARDSGPSYFGSVI
jgi:UDP-N-acetylglucosamine:LPS N-acetylglucosamine transferase